MQLIDSYPESNYDADYIDYYYDPTKTKGTGQSFTGDGGILNSVQFYLKRLLTSTEHVKAVIYAHTGTFGSTGVPTGSPLAESDLVAISSIGTSYELVSFNFSGANKITLSPGTKYVVCLMPDTDHTTGYQLNVGMDSSSPIHGGNRCYNAGYGWNAQSTLDMIFYIYKDDVIDSSPNISDSGSGLDGVDKLIKISPEESGAGNDDDIDILVDVGQGEDGEGDDQIDIYGQEINISVEDYNSEHNYF